MKKTQYLLHANITSFTVVCKIILNFQVITKSIQDPDNNIKSKPKH